MDSALLLSARAVREKAERMLELGLRGELENFTVDLNALPGVAARVANVTRAAYPDPNTIPYHSRWRHFGDRTRTLSETLAGRERLRTQFDLVITSVLLDAGAGPRWAFQEPGTNLALARSEGLAVASWYLFQDWGLRADAARLRKVSEDEITRAFQVGPDNPLVGTAGRANLLRRLGQVVQSAPQIFGGRVGGLADQLIGRAVNGALPAPSVLTAVLEALGPIWPGKGDVWSHPRLGLVPFHKLSQWLTYSLLEPLEEAGVRVTDLDGLTGLAEYRNGGLFVDGGVLVPKHDRVLAETHAVGSEVVVEWRALTVALLDRTAVEVSRLLGVALPLAKVLEGGTWSAGRQIASEKRPDGGPPIRVDSDGTVF